MTSAPKEGVSPGNQNEVRQVSDKTGVRGLMTASFQTPPTLCHFCLNGSLVFIFRWVESPLHYQRTCCHSVSPFLEGAIGLSLAKLMLVLACGEGKATAPLGPTQITRLRMKRKRLPTQTPYSSPKRTQGSSAKHTTTLDIPHSKKHWPTTLSSMTEILCLSACLSI